MCVAHYSAVLRRKASTCSIKPRAEKPSGHPAESRRSSRNRHSRKQPFLPFDVQVSIDTLKHESGGDLGEFFGLDFVEASAVDAAFRNQLGGFDNRFFTVPFGVWSGPCCRG